MWNHLNAWAAGISRLEKVCHFGKVVLGDYVRFGACSTQPIDLTEFWLGSHSQNVLMTGLVLGIHTKKKASTMATTAKWLLHIQRQLCAQLIQKNTHVYRTNMGIRMHEKINNKKSEWIKMWYIGTGVNVSSTILISIPIMSHDWKLEIFPIRTWFHIHFVVVVVSF